MSADLALATPLLEAAVYGVLERALGADHGPVASTGLTGPARAAVLTLLLARTQRRVVLVVPDDAALAAWQRDLAALAQLLGRDPRGIVVFPTLVCDPYNRIPPHPEVERERVRALGRLARRDLDLLLVPAAALLGWLPSPAEIAASSRVVRTGAVLAPEQFLLDSLRAGYRRVDTVAAPGDVSRRGGIVDIYPPEADEPVRIELFGDTVESLRSFDPDHQRSTGALSQALIGPAAENPATEAAVSRLAAEFGTPLYVYDKAAITGQFRALKAAFAPRFPVDLYEDKENTFVRAELPGVTREAINLEMVDGYLNISATRQDKDESISLNKCLHDRREVLSMWSGHNALSRHDWFQYIVSAGGGNAAAYKNNIGQRIDGAKLTNAVEENNITQCVACLLVVGALCPFETGLVQQRCYL